MPKFGGLNTLNSLARWHRRFAKFPLDAFFCGGVTVQGNCNPGDSMSPAMLCPPGCRYWRRSGTCLVRSAIASDSTMEAKATRMTLFGLSNAGHECAVSGPSSLQNSRKPRSTVVSASRRQPKLGKNKKSTLPPPSPTSPPSDLAQARLPPKAPPSTTPLVPPVLRGDPPGDHPSVPPAPTPRASKGFGSSFPTSQLESGEDGGRGGGGSAPRERVFTACAVTSGSLGALGVAAREGRTWDGLAVEFARWHVGVGVGVGLVVAIGREILLRVWPSLYESTDASNRQALGCLQPLDLLWVAILPAAGEEVLFRGALLPLLSLDWVGATVAGCVFGALHLTGGRNKAFAVWASLVGCLYGATALATKDVAAPLVAHAVANLVAGSIWKYNNQGRI